MYKRILVPLDGSKLAEMALPHAESIAATYNATLILLSVVRPHAVVGRSPADLKLFQEQLDTMSEETADYLKGLKGGFSEKNITAETLVRYGPVVGEIVDIADSQDVDLVVMASHGRSGLGRVFFGSAASGVMNRIQNPLLIIRPKENQPDHKTNISPT